jgi:hypothetical protein
MMNKKSCCFVIIVVGCVAAALFAQTATDPRAQIASMKWLAGSWEKPMSAGAYRAYYTTPDGGQVISYSELVKDGEATFYEFELCRIENGEVVFNAFPRGQKATPMTLTKCDPQARRVVFENPKKDFPTRIEYHRMADDRLIIRLTDPHNNSEKLEVYDLKRILPDP